MSTVKQPSFAGGEIDPSLHPRTDLARFAISLRTCRNYYILRHGGAQNRPGTRYIGNARYSNKAARLIDFIFSQGQAYVLEFGDLYIRVIFQGAYITEDAKDITGITQANPGVFSIIGHGYSVGDELQISGVVGMTEVNGLNFKVATVVNANEVTLEYLNGNALNTTSFGAYISGGESAKVFTIDSPYEDDDIFILKYFQSADVMTLTHSSYQVYELRRTGHTTWTLDVKSFTPNIGTPSGLTSGSSGSFNSYVVTAFKDGNFEESLPSSIKNTGVAEPSTGARLTLTWNPVTGARKYGIYRRRNGATGFIPGDLFGFLNFAGGTTYVDDGIVQPDLSDTPPVARNPFHGDDDHPACGAYVQGRLMFGNLPSNTEIVHGSRIGKYSNFTISEPIGDEDAVSFQMTGRQVNEVRHIVDLKRVVILTESGEWSCGGNSSGLITPTAINPQQHAYNGSSHLRPIVIGETLIYVQAQGSKIRDLLFSFEDDGYKGTELSIFSAHLVDDYEIVDWAYQKEPHSLVWAVRDDGNVVGLTYVREQQLVAWHRHDFNGGFVESVTSIPENGKNIVYFLIRRIINGEEVRYVERMMERSVDLVEDYIFLDSSLTYDGWNHDESQNMRITGGTEWDNTERLTLVANYTAFEASDVGKEFHLRNDDLDVVRFLVDEFVNSSQVKGSPHGIMPEDLRDTETTEFAAAITVVEGLEHLEGEQVGVFADRFVVFNPNDSDRPALFVVNGSVTLDRPYAKIHVGKSMLNDLETLDIDSAQGETMMDKEKNISRVSVAVRDTATLMAGPKPPSDDSIDPLEGLYEYRARELELLDEPVSLATGTIQIDILAEWNNNGRVFLRNKDPIPSTILSVAPAGMIPFKRVGR